MMFLSFIEQHPWWTLIYLLIICASVENIVKYAFTKKG